jgi:hypothetical protein
LQATSTKTSVESATSTSAPGKGGAVSIFTPALFSAICDRISHGDSLREVCRDPEMPHKSTVLRWLREKPELRDQYRDARDDLLEYWASDILEIADDGTNDMVPGLNKYGDEVMVPNHANVQRDRLRIHSRQWLLGKLKPKVYGDRVEHEVSGEVGLKVDITALSAREKMRRLALFMLEDKAAGNTIDGQSVDVSTVDSPIASD